MDRPHLGQTPVQNLAWRYQLLDCAGDIFNWNLWVNSVLVEKIGAEALQHTLDYPLDVFRAAVESRTAIADFEIDVPAELGCERDPISERSHAFAQDSFHLMWPVSLRTKSNGIALILNVKFYGTQPFHHLWVAMVEEAANLRVQRDNRIHIFRA